MDLEPMSSFDVVAHHRRRTRDAEARADHFETEHARLIKLLTLALQFATAGTELEPTKLLRFLDLTVSELESSEEERARLAKLLRETDPARILARAVAA